MITMTYGWRVFKVVKGWLEIQIFEFKYSVIIAKCKQAFNRVVDTYLYL